ncbi:aminotransferase class V-fold PLP-dependent enzyme [Helcococcus kunzii]|uniref:aminotransferase class V-fold PLP-dependent enzyme n=1 Tax=Helcococcus kunzii TaxID=40091 RepID=UPI0024AE6F50|nr:SufS family cysteine desulfurase [Helcococcus kunzii]
MIDIKETRKDFPFFENNKNIAFLDSAATTQKPKVVIDFINDYYTQMNANAHRGTYKKSVESSLLVEDTREKVRKFINASKTEEIIFTKNATEALNLVSYSYGFNNLQSGDEILISIAEHHSNLVNWQYIAKKTGAKLVYFYLDENLNFDQNDFENKLNKNTKIVAFTAQSNVLSFYVPVKEMIEKVREKTEAIVIIDGAQAVAHQKIDVNSLDCDFFAFSGHKLYSIQGVGVLYGKYEILDNMQPFLFGGDMIEYTYEQDTSFAELPSKFEAGTMDVAAIISLGKAIEYIEKLGVNNIYKYEKMLVDYCLEKLNQLDYIKIYYPQKNQKGTSIAFTFDGVHPHDVSQILDFYDVNIRVGHHCAQPLHRYLKINSSCRISIAFYNNFEDIDKLILALEKVKETFYGN